MRSLADFLGFLLLSIGIILIATATLLLLALIAGGRNEPDASVAWGPLFIGLGIPGVIMVAGGVLLARKIRHQ